MSILAKYSLWLISVILAASGCIAAAALWAQRDSLTREAMLRGESIALNLAAPAADALLTRNDLLLVGLAISATQDNQGVVYAALLNESGEVMGHADQKALSKPLDVAVEKEVNSQTGRARIREGSSQGIPLWDISVPVLLKGSPRILGSVHVGLSRSVVEAALNESIRRLAAIGLGILVIAVGLTLLSLRVLVRPLRELSFASQAVGSGDLSTCVPVRSHDEIGRLASNFNSMVLGLKNAETAKLEQGRIEGELALAHSIQANLLPAKPPRIRGLDIAFRCEPAKELGGDFYDCIEIKGGALWGFLIADVSGKGVPAALHMANLRNLFKVFGPEHESPLDTVKKVNSMIYPDMKSESFVTLIYAVINPKTLQVRMVNAGHDPAYWFSKENTHALKAFDSTSCPVGLSEAFDFDPDIREHQFTMNRGDMLFTFTDGVTEAMSPQSEQFSLSRLQNCLLPGGAATTVVERVMQAVNGHASGAEQSDDITMLAVKAA